MFASGLITEGAPLAQILFLDAAAFAAAKLARSVRPDRVASATARPRSCLANGGSAHQPSSTTTSAESKSRQHRKSPATAQAAADLIACCYSGNATRRNSLTIQAIAAADIGATSKEGKKQEGLDRYCIQHKQILWRLVTPLFF